MECPKEVLADYGGNRPKEEEFMIKIKSITGQYNGPPWGSYWLVCFDFKGIGALTWRPMVGTLHTGDRDDPAEFNGSCRVAAVDDISLIWPHAVFESWLRPELAGYYKKNGWDGKREDSK